MDDPASSPATTPASSDHAQANDTPASDAPDAALRHSAARSPANRSRAEPATGDAATLLARNLTLTYSHSGPLPDPHHFAAYDDVHPGAADRILTMAESALKMRSSEQHHIQTMQAREAAYAREGLRYGAALAFLIVVGLITIAILGMTVLADQRTSIVAATALGGFGALGLVGVLVNGRKTVERPRNSSRTPSRAKRRSKRRHQSTPLRP